MYNMAILKTPHPLWMFVIFVYSFEVHGQTTENPDLKLLKGDEATILTSMLHIIDKKFDTLSTRMSSLETAVNGLQFYSLRQFKIINNNLQGVTSFIQGMHGKMTQVDKDSRAVKIAVDILDHDITEFTESNKQLIEDLSKSITVIDKSVHEKSDQIKDIIGLVEETLVERISLAHTIPPTEKPKDQRHVESPKPCQVNISALVRHMDIQFTDLRNYAKKEQIQLHNVSNIVSETQNMLKSKQLVPLNIRRKETSNEINPLPKQETEIRDQSEDGNNENVECSILENERLYKALTNMTANIVQSVSYFRHTGGLFEEIITNTDLIAQEQNRIRVDIGELKSEIFGKNFTDLMSDTNDVIEEPEIVTRKPTISKPEMIVKRHKDSNVPVSDKVCSLVLKELKETIVSSRNETKLLEVVTQLVLNTSVSLSSTLIGLQNEILRLKDITRQSSNSPKDQQMLVLSRLLNEITNQTKRTHSMVRIIASNTGWMPHTFQRVGAVGEQINKSLEITQNLYGDFSNIFDIKPLSGREGNIAQTVIEGSLNRRAQTAYGEHYIAKGNESSTPSSPLLELIFNTNKQLKRIMPALTRLIAEPEPLFSLVNGEKESEGRLEVYYHGQWATMCGPNLNNDEASAICRNLGYTGGVASTRGGFGPGSGGFRSFNKTCIRTQRCPVITEGRDLARCNHAEDLGVICDHMVRVVDNDGYISRSRGRLQLYHQGKWRPVCSRGWKETEVRTACRQLGYSGGRMFNGGEVKRGLDNLFVSNLLCEKEGDILHNCGNKKWMMSKCTGYLPVALVCQ